MFTGKKKIAVAMIVMIAVVMVALEVWFYNRKIERIDELMHHLIK